VYSNVRRARALRCRLIPGNADHGLDQRRISELAPQPADGDGDRVAERVGVGVPHVFEQLLGADDPAIRGDEVLQDAELLAGQRQRLTRARCPVARPVDHEVVPLDDSGRARTAAGQRAQAGDKLGERKRLAEVVVGTEFEPVDAICHIGRGGEHEDARPRPVTREFAADPVAVHAGQVAVEDDQVVVGLGGPLERGDAVKGDVDGHPRVAQPLADALGERRIVLDHQYPHGVHRAPPAVTPG
jgi:hypothetical protein